MDNTKVARSIWIDSNKLLAISNIVFVIFHQFGAFSSVQFPTTNPP
ncbi:MAG TPA: hypothetical protein VNS08_11830 [Ureibacillus sp.]|nr:hypothetical protein [Ureibacillus sp.]